MKKYFLALLVGAIALGICASSAIAGEIDILVDKLVEKNILTPIEAQIILDETRQEVAQEVAENKSYALPAWVQKMKLKGDLRLRYQWQKKKASAERTRGRYRFRLGATTDVTDKVEVGFGLATGSDDPRSTNQTMDSTFETPDIRLDYAYAKWDATPNISLYGGKFKRKPILWQTSDLLWDGDINPTGFSAALGKSNIFENVDGFLNVGSWVLEEASSDQSDPAMYYVQPGVKWAITDGISSKLALTYYNFTGLEGKNLTHNAGTNTTVNQGGGVNGLYYSYNTLNPSFEIGMKNPLGKDFDLIKYAAFFTDFVHNPDPSENNNGYLYGVKFGDKKIKKPGQWQAKYMYRRLEKDAWVDAFPDSDAYSGDTGVKGHEASLKYALLKNVIFGLDYYCMELIDQSSSTGNHRKENLVQVDLLFKF